MWSWIMRELGVISLSQLRCNGFRIPNQFRIFYIGLKGCNVLIACNLRNWQFVVQNNCFVGILKLTTTEKWSEIIVDVDTERIAPFRENHQIKSMNMGREIHILI